MKVLLGQVFKFASVGVVATATHVAVGLGLHNLLGVQPLMANLVAFLCATSWSCVGNWSWTFDKRSRLSAAVPRYLALSTCCFGLNQTIVYVVTQLWHLPYLVALLPVVLLVPGFSFWMSRSKVFVHASSETSVEG
jgi:putative flippase GtrA